MSTIAIFIRKDNRLVCKHFDEPIKTLSQLKVCDFFQERGELWDRWTATKPGRVRPGDNGFVLVDFDLKTVSSGQSLSPINTFVVGVEPSNYIPDLFQSKRMIAAQGIFDGSNKKRIKILNSATYENFLEIAREVMGTSTIGSFLLHIKPPRGWRVVEIKTNEPAAWRDFFNMLTDMQCKLSGTDIAAWKKRLTQECMPASIADCLSAHTQSQAIARQTSHVQDTRRTYRL